ncbi:sigma factor-like helix-turn-helix DNA-binding protein [uncultured Fusobacterium sp.]|uniref:sigma factor-like helix-turn-helix DNA-binding protein n=1 Tax=uncultured Fusobacterium sp. TaxID=159267 RepID=UPI0027DB06F6|nr:sigma factor-like helix-turn-helix DNA-binding protein [uncultured Fusobacterium sp.]
MLHKERQILDLLFFKGYSGEEIAKKLGMSRQWVHSMKYRAFEKIRNNICFVLTKK